MLSLPLSGTTVFFQTLLKTVPVDFIMINRSLFDLSFLKLFEMVSEIPLSAFRLFGIVIPIRHYIALFMVASIFG